ncbi:hypothetical protein C8J56DRAFT_1166065 [Mycena floridula]|nr:hypothetical protein C8J56DRAFT_1166065 [Mycena floridula]
MKIAFTVSFAVILAVAIGQQLGNNFVDDLSSRDALDIPEELYVRDIVESEEYLYGRDFDDEAEIYARQMDDDGELLARDEELESREFDDLDILERDFDDWDGEILARDFDSQLSLEARAFGKETGKKALAFIKKLKGKVGSMFGKKNDLGSIMKDQEACDKKCAKKHKCKQQTDPTLRIISEIDFGTCTPGYQDQCLETCQAATLKALEKHTTKLPEGPEKKEMEALITELKEA